MSFSLPLFIGMETRMKNLERPSIDRLRQLFAYDPDTGILTWKTGNRAGKPVGSKNSSGYLQAQFTLDGVIYRPTVHVICWTLQTGAWPLHQIDHENHVPDDNRWVNLRAATHGENMRNLGRRKGSTSKVAGVYRDNRSGKHRAQIRIEGKLYSLGSFVAEEDAVRARKAAEIAHDWHPNHGADTTNGETPLFGDRIERWTDDEPEESR